MRPWGADAAMNCPPNWHVAKTAWPRLSWRCGVWRPGRKPKQRPNASGVLCRLRHVSARASGAGQMTSAIYNSGYYSEAAVVDCRLPEIDGHKVLCRLHEVAP